MYTVGNAANTFFMVCFQEMNDYSEPDKVQKGRTMNVMSIN